MLIKKPHIKARKAIFKTRLAERRESLKLQGKSGRQIDRDPVIRQIRGKLRQANNQLTGIAALEKQIARKAKIKAEKLAAPKAANLKKRRVANPEKKRERKEKKKAAAQVKE